MIYIYDARMGRGEVVYGREKYKNYYTKNNTDDIDRGKRILISIE